MTFSLIKRLLITLIITLTVGIGAVSAEDKVESPCNTMEVTKKYEALCTEVKVESSNPFSGNCEAIVRGSCRYNKWCIACHGPKADGVARFGKYASDLTAHWRGYGGFIEIVLNGRTGNIGMMPPWSKVLNVQQISEIGAYLETLAQEDKAYWK